MNFLMQPASALQASPLARVLAHFPPVSFAFAYGSGAHHQPGLYDAAEPLHSPSGVPFLGPEPPSIGAPPSRQASGADASTSSSSITLARRAEQGNHRTSLHAGVAGVGSGSSKGSSGKGPVIDFIFAVQDAHKWHQQNLQLNREHYSWVGRLGTDTVCGIAEAVGVGVHFNTLVPLDSHTTIKYGVIEADCLERDLNDWTTLYVAGRMHKPVTPLVTPPQRLADAELANRHNALTTALVLLPPTFTEEELLRTVVGLSYRGDVRLVVGAEDPHKVGRIMDGSWQPLVDMYMPLLRSNRYSSVLGLEVAGETGGRRGGRLWRQAKDPEAQGAALGLLPAGLLHEMAAKLGFHVPLEHLHAGASTQREVVAAALKTGRSQRLAADSVAAIVRRSSMYQAASGLLAAGGGKAVTYVAAKLGKALRPVAAAAAQQAEQLQQHVKSKAGRS